MANELKNKIINTYKSLADNGNFSNKALRDSAISEFETLGFPTLKNEEWKYTPLNFINKIDFNIATESNNIDFNMIEPFLLKENRENYIVTVNGVFSTELSKYNGVSDGIIICGINIAKEKYPELFENHFNKYNKNKEEAFSLINLSLQLDGLFIYIPKNVDAGGVYHIVHVSDSREMPVMTNPRTLVICDKSSKLRIIESIHNIGTNPSFTNSVIEIAGLDNSNIDYYKLQHDDNKNYLVGTTDVNLLKDSSFHSASITLDGCFIRNNLNVKLDGEGINANLHGFFFANADNLIDNHTFVDHAKPNCNSEEVYKGILNDRSSGVFSGKILVRPDAQKTNAYQSNKNIVLTDEAKINTKPQLEIFADDVKCSHGATTGYLDLESLYYLKSRGIGETMAKALLLNAFGNDVFDKIKISTLCDEVKSQIAKRLNIEDDTYFCKLI
jgi:Fe-S cluster assembly protein SufD